MGDDLEFKEPKGSFTFFEREYKYWGSQTGRVRTDNYEKGKFNRYAKFGHIADEIIRNLSNLVRQETNSINGRCAYASLVMILYGVRVGNEDSAEGYESKMEKAEGEIVQTYGTTTLLNEHIEIKENKLLLHFVGKELVEHNIDIEDKFLVHYGSKYWKADRLQEKWLGIDYSMIFDFVKSNIAEFLVPKDLRTFCANITGWQAIERYLTKPKQSKKSDVNKEIKEIVEIVAKRLGNTPSISKANYIHHAMLDWFKAQRFKEEK